MPIIRKKLRESSAKREVLEVDRIKPGKFKNDISITDVKEIQQQVSTEQKGVIFEYEFKTDFALEEPQGKSLGNIKIIGEIFYVDANDVVDEILNGWKNDKKVKPEIMKKALDVAFKDAQIEALHQAEKVGLPSPVPLMRLKDSK